MFRFHLKGNKRPQTLSAVNSHQCQGALAHCSLGVDKQLLTVIDSSAKTHFHRKTFQVEEQQNSSFYKTEWQSGDRGRRHCSEAAFQSSSLFSLCFYTEWMLSGGSYPGHRRWSRVQHGTGLAVDQTQFDKPTHGLGEALWVRTRVTVITCTGTQETKDTGRN